MNTTYKIKKVEKIELEGKSFIDVLADFSCEDREVISRRFNFSLDVSDEDIKNELSEKCKVIDSDFEIGEASKQLAEDNKKADGTIKSLLGSELSTKKNKKDE